MGAPGVPALLLLSARHAADVLYRDELFDLAGRKDGFELVLAVTREPPVRPGDYGRRVDGPMLVDVIKRLPSPPRHVFVCGSNGFVNAVTEAMIAASVPSSIIRTERYGV
jgi:ferredoxin-NADP reductase